MNSGNQIAERACCHFSPTTITDGDLVISIVGGPSPALTVVYISDLDVQGDSNIDGPMWIPLPREVDSDSGLYLCSSPLFSDWTLPDEVWFASTLEMQLLLLPTFLLNEVNIPSTLDAI